MAKLLVAAPLLLLAVVWSSWPNSANGGPSFVATGDRPVLTGESRDTRPLASEPDTGAGFAGRGTGGAITQTSTGPSAGGEVVAGQDLPDRSDRLLLAPHQEPRPSEAGLSWTTALRTLVSIAVVLVLIVVCARVLKYFMATAGQPGPSGAAVRVLETVHVPAPSGRGRSAIHLMEVGDRLLLIGATDSQLTVLSEFDAVDGPPALRHRHDAAGAVASQRETTAGNTAGAVATLHEAKDAAAGAQRRSASENAPPVATLREATDAAAGDPGAPHATAATAAFAAVLADIGVTGAAAPAAASVAPDPEPIQE
ncbi:MAG: flagellar biosynthetic protein FliO, partial [Acidimicrobiales bacterium]